MGLVNSAKGSGYQGLQVPHCKQVAHNVYTAVRCLVRLRNEG